MNEPVRLREAGCDEARALLGAEKLDVPGSARQRALAFTGVAASLATTGTALAGGATSLVKSVALYVCLGAVGGGAASFVVSESLTGVAKSPVESTSAAPPRALPTVAPRSVSSPESRELPLEPAAAASTGLPVQHAASPEARGHNTAAGAPALVTSSPSSPSARVAALSPSLLDEQRVIEAARSAVGRGDATRALTLLDGYEHAYGQGQFGPEALALRVEALRLRGDVARARALALEFQSRYPHHPLLARVRVALP